MSAVGAAGLHMGVAEQGKVHALRGDHVAALMHYREAMAIAAREQAPPLVLRHYVECALESLEHMGAYDEVLAYCERAVEHYRVHPPESRLARLDLATIHQRRGVALLKQGDRDDAERALALACAEASEAEARLPLADALLRWLRAQLTITPQRLAAELARHNYCSVREDTVTPDRAVSLPADVAVMPRGDL